MSGRFGFSKVFNVFGSDYRRQDANVRSVALPSHTSHRVQKDGMQHHRKDAATRNRLTGQIKEKPINALPSHRKLKLGTDDKLSTLADADIESIARALGLPADHREEAQAGIFQAFEKVRQLWSEMAGSKATPLSPNQKGDEPNQAGLRALHQIFSDAIDEAKTPEEREEATARFNDARRAAQLGVFVDVRPDVQPPFRGNAQVSAKSLYQLLTSSKGGGETSEQTAKEIRRLEDAMRTAHLAAFVDTSVSPHAIKLLFFGTDFGDRTNYLENFKTAVGTYGDMYKETKHLAEVFAEGLRDNPDIHLELVSGHSLGGGLAQIFLAALESRVELNKKPATIVFDPQLPNNSQAAFALKGGSRKYDYREPRVVAITLNSRSRPTWNLMRAMKACGYKYPGTVELQLPVRDDEVTPGLLAGVRYHRDRTLYDGAIGRFVDGCEPPPVDSDEPSNPEIVQEPIGDPGAVLFRSFHDISVDHLDLYQLYAIQLGLNQEPSAD